LNVAAHAGAIHCLSQQNGAAVAKLRHEVTELMSRIGHRDRLQTRRDNIPGKPLCQHLGILVVTIESQLQAERMIESQQTRLCDRRGIHPREEAIRQACIRAGIHGFVGLVRFAALLISKSNCIDQTIS